MRDEARDHGKHPKPGNILMALIVVGIGSILLIHQLNLFLVPHWVFTWQMLLIVLGFVIGAKKNFNGIGWMIMMLIGGIFLLDDYFFFSWNLSRYGWPLAIIVIGMILLVRAVSSPSQSTRKRMGDWSYFKEDVKKDFESNYETDFNEELTEETKKKMNRNSEDYIDQVNVFGSTKSRIFSKKFKGGETTNFFGGAELDLTQADIEGKAVIDAVAVFGGLKLVIPANWNLKTDIVSIMGGVTDKRPSSHAPDENGKVLLITGACIFGGIEISSY